jgi:hypothetical protein
VLAAIYFALGVLRRHAVTEKGFIAYDFYGQFYPWMIQAARGLRAGGNGLLWNPYQECGQPLFANIQTGLLHPLNWVFVFFDRETALLLCVVLNLSIAGLGMLQLGRALGLTPLAALCGAVAFELGWAATNVAAWSPTHIGTLTWLPVAMWRCERLVRAPSARRAIKLALVLGLQMLAGFPQIVVFTYQLIALRIGWALLLRQAPIRPLVSASAFGLLAAPLLVAVQLAPAFAVARRSLWGGTLSPAELGATFSWEALANGLTSHFMIGGNGLLILLAILAVVTVGAGRRADVAFYALAAVLAFVLSLGPGSFLFRLYELVPPGAAFRGTARLLWVTSFAVSVLVAVAADRLVRMRIRGKPIAAGWAWMLPVLLMANAILLNTPPLFAPRQGPLYDTQASVISDVRTRLTPHDRVLIVSTHPDLGLMPKSGTVAGIPNIHDYDPLVARSYAELFTFMRTGRPYRSIDDWYWLFGKLLLPTMQRPLFNLTAARYLIVDARVDRTADAFPDGLPLLLERNGVRVYENRAALPRARYVGRVQPEADEHALARLADGSIDATRVAAVSQPPRSGFTGAEQQGPAVVEFVTDEPQRVTLRLRAPAPGFLVLADQYDPGWSATVNQEPREILRANHAFRAVEVPAGDSEVVFTYRPASLLLGALLSGATLLGMAAWWTRAG